MAIKVFTPGEDYQMAQHKINVFGRYLLCCIASADAPVTFDELASYTGYDKEHVRKAVKKLETAGVVTIHKPHRKEAQIVATFI
ncbi:hypothetical protein Pondi_00051 [Escherichia phage Pondi]|nr:hypothetical protein Pondi_00051 [Escherichia phage Pondi]